MISKVRPEWIIEIGPGDGGRTLYLATICELIAHGTVLAIGEELPDDLPQHPRIQYLTGIAEKPATVEAVQSVGGDGNAIAVLGARFDRVRTAAAFKAYEQFVRPDSYVVVTDTVVNGHPVWTAFGPGPAEALRQILHAHGDFVSDPDMEKFSLTFNPSGFLK